MLRSFHMKFYCKTRCELQIWLHHPLIRSSNNLFHPFSASLVPLELFSDCFGNAVFVFCLLKATVLSEAEEGNRYFLIAWGGHDCFQLAQGCPCAALRVVSVFNLLACIFKSILRALKKPFRASLNTATYQRGVSEKLNKKLLCPNIHHDQDIDFSHTAGSHAKPNNIAWPLFT